MRFKPPFFTLQELAEYWRTTEAMIKHAVFVERTLRPAILNQSSMAGPTRQGTYFVEWNPGEGLKIAPATILPLGQANSAPWLYVSRSVIDTGPALDIRKYMSYVVITDKINNVAGEFGPITLQTFDGEPAQLALGEWHDEKTEDGHWQSDFHRFPPDTRIYFDVTGNIYFTLEEVERFESGKLLQHLKPKQRPVQKAPLQDAWLQEALEAIGIDPQAVPVHKGGNPGLKAKIKAAALQERPDLFTSASFTHAWKRLPKVDR